MPHFGGRRGLTALFADGGARGQRGGGGRFEEVVEADLDAVLALQRADDAGGQQRMAAEIEEVVVRLHAGLGQHRAQFGQDGGGDGVLAVGRGLAAAGGR